MSVEKADPVRVVIVGAGFGGLKAAKSMRDMPVDITIVDRRNHHLFQPLLYQVATAGLNPSDIAQPVRQILSDQKNCQPMLANVTGVDVEAGRIETDEGPVSFDYLVLASGATHAYFGNDQWAEHAPGLKTIEDALNIRRRILQAFERAELCQDAEERRRLMTFVVVGAGPTGVELAGAIREIATRSLRSDFRHIDTTQSRVLLVEAGPAVLPTFPPKLQRSAERQLAGLGVEVLTNTSVTEISARGAETSGSFIPTATAIWAAGVQASELGSATSDNVDRAGRLKVEGDLSLADHSNIFAIGDLAAAISEDGSAVPGVAPAAQQGGRHVAGCIAADLAGEPRPTFRYRDKGSMATIGRSKAVVDLHPRVRFGGYLAWLIWWIVHISSLVGFRSRFRTMMSWGWQYWTGHRASRLITGD